MGLGSGRDARGRAVVLCSENVSHAHHRSDNFYCAIPNLTPAAIARSEIFGRNRCTSRRRESQGQRDQVDGSFSWAWAHVQPRWSLRRFGTLVGNRRYVKSGDDGG